MGGDAWVPAAPGGRVQGQGRGRSKAQGPGRASGHGRRKGGARRRRTSMARPPPCRRRATSRCRTSMARPPSCRRRATSRSPPCSRRPRDGARSRPLKGGSPFRDFSRAARQLGQLEEQGLHVQGGGQRSWVCARACVCCAQAERNVGGRMVWCTWGVRRERARCESGERGGVVAGWAAVPEFGVRRGRKASGREGGEGHNIERKECHRKGFECRRACIDKKRCVSSRTNLRWPMAWRHQ